MPGSATTKTIKDGGGSSFTGREWDESGAGTGPFSAMPILGDGAGGSLVSTSGLLVRGISNQATDVTGTFTNATQTTSITTGLITGYQSISVSINGTYGTGTAVFEVSDDGGTTWYGVQGARTDSSTIEGGYTSLTNISRMWVVPITGADKFRVRSTAVASGTVNVTISPVGTASSDAAVVSVGAALPAGTNTIGGVAGDTASGASDAGNPIKTGGLAKTANPTAVTDGQRVASLFDKLGKQVVVGAIRDLKGMQSTTITSSTSETTIVTAAASTFLDLYGLVITNTSATVTKVTIKDSTAGTTRAVFEIPATDTRGFMLPVDSALPQATVNTNWTATCGTSVASVEIAAYYVKNI
jgi:hypothetical protein